MKSFRVYLTSRFVLRHHMGVILFVTVATGVITNKGLQVFGIEQIAWRYPLSVVGSFLGFMLAMRVWLEYLRRSYSPPLSFMELDNDSSSLPAYKKSSPQKKASKWDDSVPDLPDEPSVYLFILLVLLMLAIGGGVITLLSDAPFILTEVAFQFFLAAGLVRSAKRIDSPDWIGSVFSHTWKPFLIVLILATLFGITATAVCGSPHTMRDVLFLCGK